MALKDELKDELYAAPAYEWRRVPITVSRHKWWMRWNRAGDDGGFVFTFISPRGRCYSFFAKRGRVGRVIEAEVARANGETIADYYERWGDKPERLDAVIRLTPEHILDRLHVLLDAIG